VRFQRFFELVTGSLRFRDHSFLSQERFPMPSSARTTPVSSSSPVPGSAVSRSSVPLVPLSCLTLAGLLWGTGGIAGTELGRAAGLSPLAVAALRLLTGGGLIAAFRLVPRRRWPTGQAAWRRIALTGLLAAAFQAAYFAAVSLTSVSLATLVTIGGAPVIVQAAELTLGRRRLEPAGIATTGLALAGLGLLVGLPSGDFGTLALLGSAGMALVSSAGFAAITLLGEAPVPGLDAETVTGFSFTLGGLVLLPMAAAGGLAFRPGLAPFGWLAVLGVGPTALAYTLYFRGLQSAPASTAALLSVLEPLTATVLSVLLLGNRLSAPGIAGAVLLAGAVLTTASASRARGGGNEPE
jgi:drug/metabolite transporter, DME family